MKIEPFLLASTLRAVIAQGWCGGFAPPAGSRSRPRRRWRPCSGSNRARRSTRRAGCSECSNTGYRGRIGVFEAVRVDETIRRLSNAGGDEAVISSHAFRSMPNLGAAARNLVREGVTTAEEAVRISRRETELV
jgi:general secretion pathway protein E